MVAEEKVEVKVKGTTEVNKVAISEAVVTEAVVEMVGNLVEEN